jgi:phospholipid-binding lipoprotein MlaA
MLSLVLKIQLKKCIVAILILGFFSSCQSTQGVEDSMSKMDPWEKSNRELHQLNKEVDKIVLKPASEIYGKIIPQPIRLGFANFHNNLQEPKRFVNHVIQHKYLKSSSDFARFVLNTSVGILGVFDIASWLNLFPEDTNFDETFGYLNIQPGPYLEVPLAGPSSVRGAFGLLADYTFNPLLMLSGPIESISFITFEAMNIVNERYEFSNVVDSLLYNSSDSYASTRLTYLQTLKANTSSQNNPGLAFDLFDPYQDFE